MATEYTAGPKLLTRSEVLMIEAEDALIAALKAKHDVLVKAASKRAGYGETGKNQRP